MLSGFRIDPVERLDDVLKEATKLHSVFSTTPIFGVDFNFENEAPSIQELLQPRVEEDTELVEDQEDVHALAAYYVEGHGDDDEATKHESIQFDTRLGLAVEGMQEGVTIESLWRVV
jgi:Bardet-Biedl syndrome 5 protein